MAASLLSSERLESDQREIRVNPNGKPKGKITIIKENTRARCGIYWLELGCRHKKRRSYSEKPQTEHHPIYRCLTQQDDLRRL